MTVGELKRSLSRLPPDMDDVHVFLKLGERDFDLTCYVGYVKDPLCIVIGNEKAARIEIDRKNAGEDNFH